MVWLVVIVVVGIVAGATLGIAWGFVAAAVTLVISDLVERVMRSRRRRARGDDTRPSLVHDALTKRRRPG